MTAFLVLKKWAGRMPHGASVFTSSVDGQFLRVGLSPERIHECHGTVQALRCIESCVTQPWSVDISMPRVNSETSLLEDHPPDGHDVCRPARPNNPTFSDGNGLTPIRSSIPRG
jgi:NAD-dependent SIR2 family protein deacetylase